MQKIHCEIWLVDAGILAAVNQQQVVESENILQSFLNGSFQSSAVNLYKYTCLHLLRKLLERPRSRPMLLYCALLKDKLHHLWLLSIQFTRLHYWLQIGMTFQSNAVERAVAETAGSFHPRR